MPVFFSTLIDIFIYLYMDKFFINGGNKLFGEIKMDCAKNAVLPILAGSILVEGVICLKDVPIYKDVLSMIEILKNLGADVKWVGKNLYINSFNICKNEISHQLASPVRSSIFTLGPILARLGKAKVAYPGGCNIGLRPIDIHLFGLRELGCKINEKNGYIYAQKSKRKANAVSLRFPSVGATENIMMFACLFDGETKIYNPAKEPEIVDLAKFLNKCGAKIKGAGSDLIVINGVKKLNGVDYKPIYDRIECGTFLIAGAMTGGEIVLKNCNYNHNQVLIEKLKKCGCKIFCDKNKIALKSSKNLASYGTVETEVYPGFPTDLQSQMVSLATICKGTSFIFENLFESRFNFVGELIKMGCDIKCKSSVCIVNGKNKIFGADVVATDLRGGASLILAGLVAEGYTTISNIELVDRGYFAIENKLSTLGADIKRI